MPRVRHKDARLPESVETRHNLEGGTRQGRSRRAGSIMVVVMLVGFMVVMVINRLALTTT